MKIIVAISLMIVGAVYSAEVAGKQGTEIWKSPKGNYLCRFIPGEHGSEQGGRIYLESTNDPNKRKLLFESPRWVEVKWSSDDHWFAIIDNRDWHITSLQVYHIFDTLSDPKDWDMEMVYHSPGPMRYDSHWSIVSWNMPDGTVRIECKFFADPDKPLKWSKRSYEVPINCVASKKP